MTLSPDEAFAELANLIDRLRPTRHPKSGEAEQRVYKEAQRLIATQEDAARLNAALCVLLAIPQQASLYAEAGVRSALGLWLELTQRLRQRLLPPVPDNTRLDRVLGRLLSHPRDHEWICAVADEAWISLAEAIEWGRPHDVSEPRTMFPETNLLEAVRFLSYRLAGTALDRELLRAEPALENHTSPFLVQNAALLPLLERATAGGPRLTIDETSAISLLLDQCDTTLESIRRGALEQGISIRLTYLLSRLGQLTLRLRLLLDVIASRSGSEHPQKLVILMKTLVKGEQSRHRILTLLRDDISILARNITNHASRHGEHYIAENQQEWRTMGLAAAGGGVVIACMAIVKMRLSLLHLPPLTEGIVYGLNYGLGFVLIHLLGFSVATKQPAMTAASIASTLEEAHPQELHKLANLVQNVIRTQFVAVLGNVGLALPVAGLAALAWASLSGSAIVPDTKALHMLQDLHPLSGALFFAAVAGLGLFLSGLVSGYFDNRARYHNLAPRIAVAPRLAWLGAQRATRLGKYLDEHFGAILGNLFFGLYLGLMGQMNSLTGLPIDIRHVAFSSANLGTALVLLDAPTLRVMLPWAILGVISIALVNLVVSFSLALYIAMRSRRMTAKPLLALTKLLLKRFAQHPLAFFTPPPK